MARTPSADSHRKALDAAAQLIAERGIDRTSMDAIAEHSGVSKATLYKHWSDKEALVLEVMADLHGLHNRPAFRSGNVRADIAAVLCYHPEERSELRQRIMPHLMAYSIHNPKFGQEWRQTVMDPPRRELRRLLAEGLTTRQLLPPLDIEMSLALLLGPLLYWRIFLSPTFPDPAPIVDALVDTFFRAHSFQQTALKKNPK